MFPVISPSGDNLHFGEYPARKTAYLVLEADQVVSQLLDSLCRVTGLSIFAVVAEQDGLVGLCDCDAFLPLPEFPVSAHQYVLDRIWANRNLSSIDGPIFGPGHDISIPSNKQSVGKGLVLHGIFTSDNVCNGLHLFRLDLCITV